MGTTSSLSEVIDYELHSWVKEGLWYKMRVLKRRELELATCKIQLFYHLFTVAVNVQSDCFGLSSCA